MRILLGSIAIVDEGQEPGITSPDYVVFKPTEGVVHHRWLYYWLRSAEGAAFLRSLARGAVRERLLFRRLACASIEMPAYELQRKFAEAIQFVEHARAATEVQLEDARALAKSILRNTFLEERIRSWHRRPVSEVGQLLPSRSLSSTGEEPVRTVTTACLTEFGFDPRGIKSAFMSSANAADSRLGAGEILIARSNTPDLVGRASLYEGCPQGLVASDLTIRLLPNAGINPRFLSGYFSYLYASGYWKNRAGGASGSMKKITRTQLLAERIPFPGREEEDSLAERLSTRLASAKNLAATLAGESEALSWIPAALLRRAFSVEL